MKKLLIVLAIAFQVGAVAAIALHKEWVLRSGQTLVVQTAPIDPRDIFRGDYVRLDYLFSRLRASQIDPALRQRGLRKGERVYLAMATGSDGIASAQRVQLERPPFPYLPGRVRSEWPYRGYRDLRPEQRSETNTEDRPLWLEYGIGQYYVEQGKGLEMEAIRGGRNDFQRAMLVELAVPATGQALIRGFRWADVSVFTEVLERPRQDAPDNRAGARLRLTLRNESDRAFELKLKPDGCSFDLLPAGLAPGDAEQLLVDRSAFCAGKQAVMQRLDPGETLTIDFDFNQPQWQAIEDGETKPIGRLPWNYLWRLVYREPLPEGLSGRILSRAFHAAGRVD